MSPVIPYRFTILAAGLGHMNVLWFAVISVVVHFVRYALVTYLVAHYGAQAVHFVRTRLPLVFTVIGVLALVVCVAYAYY
jgi:uncharacterized membrane protein YdjX (TVP38/TMEM64 family)